MSEETCWCCEGTGMIDCTECEGTGMIDDQFPEWGKCSFCDGECEVCCDICFGDGAVVNRY